MGNPDLPGRLRDEKSCRRTPEPGHERDPVSTHIVRSLVVPPDPPWAIEMVEKVSYGVPEKRFFPLFSLTSGVPRVYLCVLYKDE